MPPTRVAIIGAALDLGAGRRGVDMGPSAIRYAGLSERLERAGIEVEDRGNVQAALGLCDGFSRDGLRLPALDPQRVALVGVRSLDPGEQALVRDLGIAVYTISDLDRRGMEPVINEALERVAGGSFVHVSVDLDVVDPEVAPGVGDPVRGGLSYREVHLALELVAEAGVLDALDLVEVNPIHDHENTTAGLAVELAASAFGVKIL